MYVKPIIAALAALTVVSLGVRSSKASPPPACPATCPSLPNHTVTPGAVLTTSKKVVCTQKTSTIRNVPTSLKHQIFARYGYTGSTTSVMTYDKPQRTTSTGSRSAGPQSSDAGAAGPGGAQFEIDHLVSLELGGSNSIKNLWPESYTIQWNAHVKDALENRLHKMVCDGSISLKKAQDEIRSNWITAYKKYVGPGPH